MPTSLQLVVQSRLSRWPKLTPIVQSASILGRDFPVSILQKMSSLSEADVADTLELLAREGLFERSQTTFHDRARFKHTMICEAVYNTLLASDKQRLHSGVADLLTGDYRSIPDATPDVIAEHLRKATRFAEAINVRLAESVQTAARGAYVETEGHCVAALALVQNLSDPAVRTALQFRLLIQLGVALTGRHGYSAPAVENTYRRAQEVCGDSAEAEMLYPIMRGLATVNLVRGDLAIAYDLSLQAFQLAEQSKRLEFRIDAMSVLCYTTFYYGRLDGCRGWIERCLEFYRAEHGERLTYPVPQDAATAAIALLPTVAWLLGDTRGSEQAVHDGLAHVERLDRDFDRALLRSWIAGTRYTQRRYSEALESAVIAVSISEKHGYREWYAIGTLVAMLAKAALGLDPEAIVHATAICAEFAREGVGLNASYYLWGLARAHVRVGNSELARELLDQASLRAEASRETRMNAELAILQAELEPDDVRAASLLRNALALAEGQGDLVTALRAAASLVIRSSVDEAMAESARATLDMLNVLVSYPDEHDWVMKRLAFLQHHPETAESLVSYSRLHTHSRTIHACNHRPSSTSRFMEQRIRYQLPGGTLIVTSAASSPPSRLQNLLQLAGPSGGAQNVSLTVPFGPCNLCPIIDLECAGDPGLRPVMLFRGQNRPDRRDLNRTQTLESSYRPRNGQRIGEIPGRRSRSAAIASAITGTGRRQDQGRCPGSHPSHRTHRTGSAA